MGDEAFRMLMRAYREYFDTLFRDGDPHRVRDARNNVSHWHFRVYGPKSSRRLAI